MHQVYGTHIHPRRQSKPDRRTRRVIDPERDCLLCSVSPQRLASLSGRACGCYVEFIGRDSLLFKVQELKTISHLGLYRRSRVPTCMNLPRQWLGCNAERNGSIKAPTSAPISSRVGFIWRDDSHPTVILSGWSGADERRDHSAVLNAWCVDGLRMLRREHPSFMQWGYTDVTLLVSSDHAPCLFAGGTEWTKPGSPLFSASPHTPTLHPVSITICNHEHPRNEDTLLTFLWILVRYDIFVLDLCLLFDIICLQLLHLQTLLR